jgi:hypothetical protein
VVRRDSLWGWTPLLGRHRFGILQREWHSRWTSSRLRRPRGCSPRRRFVGWQASWVEAAAQESPDLTPGFVGQPSSGRMTSTLGPGTTQSCNCKTGTCYIRCFRFPRFPSRLTLPLTCEDSAGPGRQIPTWRRCGLTGSWSGLSPDTSGSPSEPSSVAGNASDWLPGPRTLSMTGGLSPLVLWQWWAFRRPCCRAPSVPRRRRRCLQRRPPRGPRLLRETRRLAWSWVPVVRSPWCARTATRSSRIRERP